MITIKNSIESRKRTYVKGYDFLSFARNIRKGLSKKYSQKRFDKTEKLATDVFMTVSKDEFQKKQKRQ